MPHKRDLPLWRQYFEDELLKKQRRQNAYSAGTIVLAGTSVVYGAKSLINTMTLRGSSSSSNPMDVTIDEIEPVAKETEKLQCGLHTTDVAITSKSIDGLNNISVKIAGNHVFPRHDSVKHFFDMLFPKRVYHIKSYGTILQGSNGAATSTGPTGVFGGAIQNGLSRDIFANAGQQYFGQILHIGGGSTVVGKYGVPATTNVCPSTGVTFTALNGMSIDSQTITSSFGSSALFPNSNSIGQFRNAVDYKGGSTTHFFMNPGNADIFFEFWVARPKKFLAYGLDPVSLAMLSKNLQKPAYEPLSSVLYPTDSVVPGLTSKMFSISSRDIMLHENYSVSKPHSVRISPGATLKIAVKHAPFCFTESPENFSLLGGLGGDTDITYYPFCSTFLVMRMHGIVATNDAGTSGGSSVSLLNLAPCQLAHWQDEVHTVQAAFQNQSNGAGYVDYMTDVLTTNYVVNPKVDKTDQDEA